MSYTATPVIPTYSALGPSDDDDFLIDFSGKLAGATITTLVSVTATPSGLTLIAPSIVAGTAGAASAVAFGATVGTPSAPGTTGIYYTVSASVVTSDGRDLTRSAVIPVQPR